MGKLLIRNGRVLDPGLGMDQTADVLLEDELIAGIGNDLDTTGAEVFDATGCIVAPGFIDIHVHLREPGFEHAETIETGSRAAAAGGFTAICCMPNTNPINDSATVTSYIVSRAERFAVTRVFPIGAITKGSAGEELASFGAMRDAGIVAISDDGRPVMNARILRRAMEFAKAYNLPLIEHCEDLHLSGDGVMHEGFESTRLGLRGIPAAAEDVMVARDILLAELTGARYHVAHISTRRATEMVAFAKSKGLKVTSEVCPHHFALDDSACGAYDSNFKMKPPLRDRHHIEATIEGLKNGAIDAIATDHAPHAGSEKMQEFERCPFGITGLETAVGIALKELVHPGHITLARMVELFTSGPASVIGLPLGALKKSAAGDVTIFDTETEWLYDAAKSYSKSNNSPYNGTRFQGGPVAAIVKGAIVWSRDKGFR